MKLDKEIIGYEVLFNRNDELEDGNDIVETYGTDKDAINRAKYLSTIPVYTNIRIHQICGIIW